jgi:hypothetical protein
MDIVITVGTIFYFNDEEWCVIEDCCNKDSLPIGYYACLPVDPWSEYQGAASYWTAEEIREYIR